MINSKTEEEMSKSYNFNNTLLSIKTKTYFNYIKTEEQIFPMRIKDIKQIHSIKIIPKTKIIDIPENNENNNSFDDDLSPKLNFFPTKINLGLRKFNIPKRKTKKHLILDGISELGSYLSQPESNRNQIYNSTKIPKKGLYKLVDKIMNIKMNEDIEKIIKKNIIKLRKYCQNLKKEKVKSIKQNKLNLQIIQNNKKISHKLTSIDNKKFFKKSLFGSMDKNNDSIIKIKRRNSVIKTFIEKNEIQSNKKKEKELNKRISSQIITKNISIKKVDKFESPKRRKKIRRLQTLSGNFKNQKIESKLKNKIKFTKNSDKIENPGEFSTKHSYHTSKHHHLSSRFENESKYIINTDNNPPNIKKESQKSRFISFAKNMRKELFKSKKRENTQTSLFNNKEKKEKSQNSNRKNCKNQINIQYPFFHSSNKNGKYKLFYFDKKSSKEKEKGFISVYNQKTRKTLEFPKEKIYHN